MDWLQFYILNENIKRLNQGIQETPEQINFDSGDALSVVIILAIATVLGVLFIHWHNKYY